MYRSDKHLHKKGIFFIFIFFVVFLSGCNSSPKAHQEVISPTPTHENLKILSGKSASSNLLLKDVVERISTELKSNKTEIKVNTDKLKYLENPIGNGIFIYYPDTEFFGVERNFIWVFLNDNVYVVNGATRDITPNVLVARDVPSEVWDSTNISPDWAADLIAYIFEGKELIPLNKASGPTQIPYPEILFGHSTEERKQIFYDMVKAEDKAYSENKGSSFFHQEVADIYGITLEQLEQIGYEGLSNHWPMPPYK